MPKITDEPLDVIQIRIFRKDHQVLKRLYGNDPRTGVGKAIRAMVRSFVTQTEAQINSAIDEQESTNINLHP